jgi:hypothetical protein
MKDFLLQDLERGDILLHIRSTKKCDKPHFVVFQGSFTQGGKIRGYEFFRGYMVKSTFDTTNVIKISKEKALEMCAEKKGVAYSGINANNLRGNHYFTEGLDEDGRKVAAELLLEPVLKMSDEFKIK